MEQLSPAFTIGGAQWQLRAHLNGDADASREHLAVYLKGLPTGSRKPARRARWAVTIEGGKGTVCKDAGKDWFESGGWGWAKFCSHAGEPT